MALAKIPDFGPSVRRPASRRPGAGVWGPQAPRIVFCFEGPISLQDELMDMRPEYRTYGTYGTVVATVLVLSTVQYSSATNGRG